jgi:uncharacterized protein
MKLIALEEHFVTAGVLDAWSRLDPENADDTVELFKIGEGQARLEDLSEERLRQMNDSGVDVQVLSLTTPATQNLAATEAVGLAREANDLVAATVRRYPDRFQGFATLPTPAPVQAAYELQRAVDELGFKGAMLCGRTRERNLDHPDFAPLFEAAAKLCVPLYIHPQIPQRAVREAYYSGFDDWTNLILATGGLGWHFETGVQFIRLVLAGVFDRHPDLQIILGHWGEVVLFYLERLELLAQARPQSERSISSYAQNNLYITPSGMFSHTYLRRTIETVGIERILFSTDYPFQFAGTGGARAFLETAELEPEEKELIAHGNWERLSNRL